MRSGKMADESVHWGRIMCKVAAVGTFARHCIDHVKAQQELRQFIKDMRQKNNEIQRELQGEVLDAQRFHIRRTSVPPPERPSRETTSTNGDKEIICCVCQEALEPFKETAYPCRVCDRIFHKKCALSIQNVHHSQTAAIERANTHTGWSCHTCGDLSLLLTEDELESIIEKFEDYEVNQNSRITLKEFTSYKKRTSITPMTDQELQHLLIEFRLVDSDMNGAIDWWEFLNYQSKLKLLSRKQDDLVELLTDKEIAMAQLEFERLDVNHDGFISEAEAKRRFSDWYKRFDLTPNKTGYMVEKFNPALDLHAHHATKQVMESDTANTGKVVWKDFLAGQAAYIIGSRPNMTEHMYSQSDSSK